MNGRDRSHWPTTASAPVVEMQMRRHDGGMPTPLPRDERTSHPPLV